MEYLTWLIPLLYFLGAICIYLADAWFDYLAENGFEQFMSCLCWPITIMFVFLRRVYKSINNVKINYNKNKEKRNRIRIAEERERARLMEAINEEVEESLKNELSR
jgi:hypothetical protein